MVNPQNSPKYPLLPKSIEYPDKPLYNLLDKAVAAFPDATALTIESGSFDKIGTMTYKEFSDATDKFAAYLASKGIVPGDRVAVFLPNMIEFVIAYYGIMKAGAIVVSLNFQYPARELEFQLKETGTKGIVTADMITAAAQPYEVVKSVRDAGNSPLEFIVVATVGQYLSKIKSFLGGVIGKKSKKDKRDTYMHEIYNQFKASDRPSIEPPKPDDIAVLMFTGGTTGAPKAAMLTHRNLYANVLQGATWLDPPPKTGHTQVMGSLPFYHSFGATTAMNVSVHFCGNLVCMMDPRENKFTKLKFSVQFRVSMQHC